VIEMIGRRVVGLALFGALTLCAFAAESAAAAKAVNTTAFTCAEGAGKDFSDFTCNIKVSPGTGSFGHVAIAGKTETEIQNVGFTTLKGELAGAKLEVTCSFVGESSSLTNSESEKAHSVSGATTLKINFCTVNKPSKCTIKEPVVTQLVFEGVEGLGAGKNEMGLEFKPKEGTTFFTMTFEGKECALKGVGVKVQGTAIATGAPFPTEKHTSTSLAFTNAMTKETLSIGGKPAELEAAMKVRMSGGENINGISLTTVT
jgi:hypothetical protein